MQCRMSAGLWLSSLRGWQLFFATLRRNNISKLATNRRLSLFIQFHSHHYYNFQPPTIIIVITIIIHGLLLCTIIECFVFLYCVQTNGYAEVLRLFRAYIFQVKYISVYIYIYIYIYTHTHTHIMF